MSSPRNVALRVAALATLGAGVIHLAVVGDHASAWWVSGVFFGLLTAFQLGWGLVVLARPPLVGSSTRTGAALLGAGAVVNGGAAVLWAITRWVTGEPFGPNAGTELPVGPAGIASTVLEIVALGALVVGPRLHTRPVRGLAPVLLALGIALVAPTTAWGLAGGMSHDHGSHGDGEDPGHHEDDAGHDEGGHDDKAHDEGGHDGDDRQPAPSPQPANQKSPAAPRQPSTPTPSPEQDHHEDAHDH